MDAVASHPDDVLHRLVHAGKHREAGEWLVRAHAPEVVSLCRVMSRSREDADDLAQDVFTRAVQALPSFRGHASSRTWLLSIARNRCIDHLRARKRDPWRGVSDEPDAIADETAMPHDLISRRAEVDRALAELAEGERALVVLRYRHELEFSELAEVFGLREGAVRMRISRALSRMRAHLDAADLSATLAAPAAAPLPASPMARPSAAPAMPAPRRARRATDETQPTPTFDLGFGSPANPTPQAPAKHDGRGLAGGPPTPARGAGAVPDPLHLYFVATDEPIDLGRFLRAVA